MSTNARDGAVSPAPESWPHQVWRALGYRGDRLVCERGNGEVDDRQVVAAIQRILGADRPAEAENGPLLCLHRGKCGKLRGPHDVHVQYDAGASILSTWWDDPIEGPRRLRQSVQDRMTALAP